MNSLKSKKPMKTQTLTLALLAGALASSALACDLCSIYSAAQAHGELGKGFFVGAASQFTHYGTIQTDGVKTPNDLPQHLDSSVSQLVAGYNFTERFGMQFNLPAIHRSFQRPDGAGGLERGRESGFGDASVTANFIAVHYEKMNFTFRWSLFGGLKIPSGSSRRINEEVLELTAPEPPDGAPASGIHGHDLALGSGSVDGIIGTGIFLRRNRCFFTANAQYTLRTKGDFEYRYANDLAWSGGPGFFVALKDNYTVALQLNISGEDKGRDTFQGAVADDTGITTVYVGPEVRFSWSEKLSAQVGIDLPVSINNTSLQAVPDYRVRVGLTWHF